MVVRYRVEIYKIKNHVYKCEFQASPCDLSEVKDLMFSQDEDGGNSFSDKILDIGGICAIAVEGDVKSPKIGVCFWQEATKTIKIAGFFDNTAHDKLESILVRLNPMEGVITGQPKYKTVKKILERNNILPTELSPKRSVVTNLIENVMKKEKIEEKPEAVKAFTILQQHIHVDLLEVVNAKKDSDTKIIEMIEADDYMNLNSQGIIDFTYKTKALL